MSAGFLHRSLRLVTRAAATFALIGLVAIGTVLFLRGYAHARRQLVPTVVTPSIDYETVSRPSFMAVVRMMKQMTMIRLGLLPSAEEKIVALTFDDGPYPLTTPHLLDVLHIHRVKATFFVVGRDAQMQPELLRRIVSEGHELSNHSFTHPSFVSLDVDHITEELSRSDRVIAGITGITTRWMRPPGGRLDRDRMRHIQGLGYSVVFDNVNPGDWQEDDPLRMYTFTMLHSINRAIILLHSGREVTIQALPAIIDAYKRKGYKFLTISELCAAP